MQKYTVKQRLEEHKITQIWGRTSNFSMQHRSKQASTVFSAYRHRSVVLQTLPPQLNPLHGSQVGTCPVKPLVVTVAPLAVMD